jgi:lysophospholipase L1-like esterase
MSRSPTPHQHSTPAEDSSKPDPPPPALAKLSRWYSTFSILFLNTVLLAVVVLFVMDFALDRLQKEGTARIYSQHFDLDSYTLTSPEDAIRIGRDFDLMGERESYMFNPWTTFTERPFDGELVHIEQRYTYPTRATSPPAPREEGQSDLLVWAFGGSTMLGWGVGDEYTTPSQLQKELQTRLPDRHVVVVNHGHAYYFSSQEVSLYIALLRAEEQPDVVVFLDGLNDVALIGLGREEPRFAPWAEAGWESERQRRFYGLDMPWFAVNGSFPPLRLANYLQLRADAAAPGPAAEPELPEDPTARILEVYRLNREIAGATSERLGINAFFFLQPLGPSIASEPTYQAVYEALRAEAAAGDYPAFYDISDALTGVAHAYVDESHYSDTGNQIVAQHMADIIAGDVR